MEQKSAHCSNVFIGSGLIVGTIAGDVPGEFKQPMGDAVTLRPLMLPSTEVVAEGDEVPVPLGCRIELDGLNVGHKLEGT